MKQTVSLSFFFPSPGEVSIIFLQSMHPGRLYPRLSAMRLLLALSAICVVCVGGSTEPKCLFYDDFPVTSKCSFVMAKELSDGIDRTLEEGRGHRHSFTFGSSQTRSHYELLLTGENPWTVVNEVNNYRKKANLTALVDCTCSRCYRHVPSSAGGLRVSLENDFPLSAVFMACDRASFAFIKGEYPLVML